jgi:hypothetical protein
MQLLIVCCKPITEMANFHLFAANGNRKWKFVFLSQQTINSTVGARIIESAKIIEIFQFFNNFKYSDKFSNNFPFLS